MKRCDGRKEILGTAQQVLRLVEDAFLGDGEGTEAVAVDFVEDAIHLGPETGAIIRHKARGWGVGWGQRDRGLR